MDGYAAYLFHQGTNYYSYKYLGVHKTEKDVYVFRVFAPNAESVHVVGNFCNWHSGIAMNKITDQGIWECCVQSKTLEGQLYKFLVKSTSGKHYKSDPYARFSQTRDKNASIVYTVSHYKWNDEKWLALRSKSKKNDIYNSPINIYEINLNSWLKNNDENLNYRRIVDELIPYVVQMGYTHVEVMPVMEHPLDASWGYQICGYYAPTSRYGTPDDFKYFIDALHCNGIGVILDWVPAHFPKDEHGLFEFDGDKLYEFKGADRMEHAGWGTRKFDIARCEVQSFLISNALFWLGEYHADGLRVDAVASMLYLDYDRMPGEWNPNIYGGNQSLEGIAFFKKLNSVITKEFPHALMIAEESGDWHMITKPVSQGGIGFDFKWDMGFANDMFEYMSSDPVYRQYIHEKITFSMMYAFNEKYILPLSHDEVVHGKKSLLNKMHGSYEQKFANLRAFMVFYMTHPGKKTAFMGCEYGQFSEWDNSKELEWFMTDFSMHKKLQYFNADINHLYLNNAPLWENDCSWDGFKWIFSDLKNENLIVYSRLSASGELLVAINFSGVERSNFEIPVSHKAYTELLNSDGVKYGGSGVANQGALCAVNGRICVNLPALCGIIFKPMAEL
ncbi:MAG: 1,4-alpha-glucan branching protein GlgB [Ruminococcaceae bacterium]|nr:1,4-alpha-glucan branching protein GlgB [Oscillospiraceae bacterium]